MTRVGAMMGSDSGLSVVKPAQTVLAEVSVPRTMRIMLAHRTLAYAMEFAATAKEKEIRTTSRKSFMTAW